MHRFMLRFCLMFSAFSALGASPSLHERVAEVYSFSPHTIDQKQIEVKSHELDNFWSDVEKGGSQLLDELRIELARSDAPPFFYYDGAKLLLTLTEAREDKQLALDAIVKADLIDIDSTDYFYTIHRFAVEEFDTTEAAFKVLAIPEFYAIVSRHAMTLDQEMCLVYMLLPTKEEFYLGKAERRLFTEKDIAAQKSLLFLIAHTVTKSGDETIARFAASKEKPEESRNHAKQIIRFSEQAKSAFVPFFPFKSYDSLKAEQRKIMARVSDEALYEWDRLRLKIRKKGYQ